MQTRIEELNKRRRATMRNINSFRSAFALTRGTDNEVEYSIRIGQGVSREMATFSEIVAELLGHGQPPPLKWRNLSWAIGIADWWKRIEDHVFLKRCGISATN